MENASGGYIPAIKDLFLRAKDRLKGRDDISKVKYGLKLFKRKLLGFCGSEGTKSIDDIAGALKEIGVVSSVEEGKRVMPLLEKVALFYDEYKCLIMKRINEEKYRIDSYIASKKDLELLIRD